MFALPNLTIFVLSTFSSFACCSLEGTHQVRVVVECGIKVILARLVGSFYSRNTEAAMLKPDNVGELKTWSIF